MSTSPDQRTPEARAAFLAAHEGNVVEGNCLDVMSCLPSGAFALILADLPYGTTACSWDAVVPLVPMWQRFNRLLRPGGAIVLTASQPFTSALVASNLSGFSYAWVWDKNVGANFVQAKRQPLKVHEDVLVFTHDGKCPAYTPQMETRERPIRRRVSTSGGKAIPMAEASEAATAFRSKDQVYSEKYPSTILHFPLREDRERGMHPTQKPVELFRYLVRTYSAPGDLVLDPTAGSGTTGAACIAEGRRFVLAERDPTYCGVIQNRITKYLRDVS